MAHYDDLPIQRITVVSIVSIAVTVVTILAVQVMYFGMQNYVNAGKSATGRYSDSDEVLDSQRASISRFGVSETDARFVIPIEQAMKDIVRKASGKNVSDSAKTEET
jgi:hypothetical protein